MLAFLMNRLGVVLDWQGWCLMTSLKQVLCTNCKVWSLLCLDFVPVDLLLLFV